MGISNGRAHLERKMSTILSELHEKRKMVESTKASVEGLPALITRVEYLERLVCAAELLLRDLDPTWNCSRVKPRRKHSFKSPFGIGQAGPMALDVLREATDPITTRDMVRIMLERVGVTNYDRDLLDKQSNSLGAYLKKHDGDLVKSDGAWPQKWWVIR